MNVNFFHRARECIGITGALLAVNRRRTSVDRVSTRRAKMSDPPKALILMGDEIETMTTSVQELQQFAMDAKSSGLFGDEEVESIVAAAEQMQLRLDGQIRELQQAMHVWQHDITELQRRIDERRAMIGRYTPSLGRAGTNVMEILAAGQIDIMKKLEEAQVAIGVVPDDAGHEETDRLSAVIENERDTTVETGDTVLQSEPEPEPEPEPESASRVAVDPASSD